MSEHQAATTTRHRVADTVAGKTKEAVGAVIGNDRMVQEFRADEQRLTHEAQIDVQRVADEQRAHLDDEQERIESDSATKLWEAAERGDDQVDQSEEVRARADAEYDQLTRQSREAEQSARAHREVSSSYRQRANELGRDR